MKKILALPLAALIISGCSSGEEPKLPMSTLLHHHYVLTSIDGIAVNLSTTDMRPSIEFGENMTVSAVMCNNFHGQGVLHGNNLRVKKLVSTRKMCLASKLNQWDTVISDVLTQGTQLSFDDQSSLVLENASHTLTYRLRDWKY